MFDRSLGERLKRVCSLGSKILAFTSGTNPTIFLANYLKKSVRVFLVFSKQKTQPSMRKSYLES